MSELQNRGNVAILGGSVGSGGSAAFGALTVTGNSSTTTINVVNTYVNLDFSATALLAEGTTQWRINNATFAAIEYEGSAPFVGSMVASLGVLSLAGMAVDGVFRVLRNGLVLPEDVEFEARIATTTRILSLVVPVTLETNDVLRIQVKNMSGIGNFSMRQLSYVMG